MKLPAARCRLSSEQVRKFSEALLMLYSVEDDETRCVIGAMQHIIPAGWIAIDEVFPASTRVEHRGGINLEDIPNLSEAVRQLAHENPTAVYLQTTGFTPVAKISSFVTFRELCRTGFYEEVLKHLTGFRDQLAAVLRLSDSFLGITLNRDRAFTDEEETLLCLLQPHLERMLHRSLQYGDLPSSEPLTPREREVLHWVAEGKTNVEIAVIIQAKPRTVEQHVRAIMRKLSVETRTAAAAVAWRARTGAREKSR